MAKAYKHNSVLFARVLEDLLLIGVLVMKYFEYGYMEKILESEGIIDNSLI
jgi:hypothetical protein